MRTRKKWVGIAVVLILAGGGAGGYFLWRYVASPDSLVAAILQRKDELPGSYFVVLPQSAASALGRQAEGGSPVDADGDRRVTVEAVPCFFIAPTERRGLGEMAVHYRSGGKLLDEMGQAAKGAKVDLSESDSADMSLSDLRLVQAVGIPNPSAPCFTANAKQRLTVATSELVAGKAELIFSKKIDLGVDAGIAGGTSANVNVGFSLSENGNLVGKDIVLGASFQQVEVEVVREKTDLGTTPAPGNRIEFPLGLDGSLTVQEYNHAEGRLEVQVATTLNTSSEPPEGLKTCEVGKKVAIMSGARCDFWLAPGNGLLAVEWSLQEVAGDPHVILHLKAYRTNFAPRVNGNMP